MGLAPVSPVGRPRFLTGVFFYSAAHAFARSISPFSSFCIILLDFINKNPHNGLAAVADDFIPLKCRDVTLDAAFFVPLFEEFVLFW